MQAVSSEGPNLWREAIKALQMQEPLEPLVWHPALSLSSRDHVTDIGPKGSTGHSGSDESIYMQRISRYVSVAITASGENIAYGKESGLSIVLALFVDEGSAPDRPQRANM